MKKIILVGYMGSGKSTVGRVVAENLKIKYVDLDDFIEEKERLSIRDIFELKGEIYFRKLEHKYLKELLSSQEVFVMSLGGGTPCYANNHLMLSDASVDSFYLKLSIKDLKVRLLNEKNRRPLIATVSDDNLEEFIAKHLFDRMFYYQQCYFTIPVNNDMSAEEVAGKIIASLT